MAAMGACTGGGTRGRRAARPWAALAALAVALAVGGCGLFTPAEPEPPGGGEGTVRLPSLTDPDSALYSLVSGIETKNSQLYQHAIADSPTVVTDVNFHAEFDPQDILDYPVTPPSDWASREEKTFFPYLAGLQPVTYDVYFTEDQSRPDQRGPQVSYLYRRYRIYAGSQPLAVGLADLTFQRAGVNQEWKLVRWVDRRDTSDAGVWSYGRRRLNSL